MITRNINYLCGGKFTRRGIIFVKLYNVLTNYLLISVHDSNAGQPVLHTYNINMHGEIPTLIFEY